MISKSISLCFFKKKKSLKLVMLKYPRSIFLVIVSVSPPQVFVFPSFKEKEKWTYLPGCWKALLLVDRGERGPGPTLWGEPWVRQWASHTQTRRESNKPTSWDDEPGSRSQLSSETWTFTFSQVGSFRGDKMEFPNWRDSELGCISAVNKQKQVFLPLHP